MAENELMITEKIGSLERAKDRMIAIAGLGSLCVLPNIVLSTDSSAPGWLRAISVVSAGVSSFTALKMSLLAVTTGQEAAALSAVHAEYKLAQNNE